MEGTLYGKQILLIEDSADIQAFVSTVARLEGASVTVASTGEDGLETLKQHSDIDLVLLDVELPGIQGWDVLQEVPSTHHSVPPPVVIFSAYTDAPTRERAAELGAIGFIAKPIGARELVEQLRAYLFQ